MNCNCKRPCDCNECDCKPKCDCGCPTLEVREMPDDVAMLQFNFGGTTTWYNARNMVQQTQTDTTLTADSINRVLKYMAERHTDTISAKELGAILHLADISDVNVDSLEQGSILTYKKESNCDEGCEGISNMWEAFNALDNITSQAQYPAAFNANGELRAIQTPTNPNKHYQLGWNGSNKLSYTTPRTVSRSSIAKAGKVAALYMDQDTGEIVAVLENA